MLRRLSFLVSISLLLLWQGSHAVDVEIRNDCPYTVWAASLPGGGRQLDQGQTWKMKLSDVKTNEIWARTNCRFDKAGKGKCVTGDCNGTLECTLNGKSPYTLAEIGVFKNRGVFYHISLLDGFNVPIEIRPVSRLSDECNMIGYGENKAFKNNMYISFDEDVNESQIGFPVPDVCSGVSCSVDLNKECPPELRASGGCRHPCDVFKNEVYCCYTPSETCGATYISNYFRERCPNAFTYPSDNATDKIHICSDETNYRVVFCPR